MDFFNKRIMSMSQAGSTAGGGGPVGPAIETITGNSGGPVSPAGNNINVVFDQQATTLPPSGFTAVGNLVPNTLTLEQFLYSAVTVGATSQAIFTLPLNSNQAAIINADVIALRSDNAAAGVGRVVAGGRRDGGGALIVNIFDDTIIDDDPTGNLALTFTAAGNNLIISVDGIAGQTYTWSAYVRYHTQP
jgi:hypothetical protein